VAPQRTSLRASLAVPGIPVAVVGAFLGRLSNGMTPLGTVLLVRDHGGSYAAAGLCTASFALASAIGSPIRGRLVDRRGHTAILLACGSLYAGALALMVVAASSGARPTALPIAAALAGITYPPLSAALLGMWAAALGDPVRIQTAYAFDASCAEAGFLVGSLLVAVVAGALSSQAAMLLAAVFGALGTLLFAGSRRSRAWRPGPPPPVPTTALGADGVKTVLAHALAIGASVGALEIAVPAFAEAHGALDRSGLLFAVYSIGSVVGGLWLGSRAPAVGARLVRRYLLLLAGADLAAILLPTADRPLLLVPILVLNGFFLAPIVATMYLLLERLSPPENRTETFAWLNTAIFSGAAAGSAATGALTQGHGPTLAMVAVAVAATGAALGAAGTRVGLTRTATQPGAWSLSPTSATGRRRS
jgi:MFS family permease